MIQIKKDNLYLVTGGSGFLGKNLVEKDSDSFEVISTFNNHKIEH